MVRACSYCYCSYDNNDYNTYTNTILYYYYHYRLDGVVVPIQVVMRRWIANRIVRDMTGDLDDAALKIQQRFRMYKACDRMGKELFKREIDYRDDVITMIIAEEEWASEQLVKMASRIGKNTLKEELENAATVMHARFDEIYNIENEYMETSR